MAAAVEPLLWTPDKTAAGPETLLIDSRESAVPPSVLNVKQVASLLAVSSRHIYRMADAGLMPRPLKLGSLNRWPKTQIDEWIKAGAKPVRSQKSY